MALVHSWLSLPPLCFVLGAAGGYLSATLTHPKPTVAARGSDSSTLETRMDELEQQCLRFRHHTPGVAASLPPAGPHGVPPQELEMAVRSLLTRLDSERSESSASRRIEKQESKIAGFIELVGKNLALPESKTRDLEAVLLEKSDDWAETKATFQRDESTMRLTPRQRKEARNALKVKANEALRVALSELLDAEQLDRFEAIASAEHFDFD